MQRLGDLIRTNLGAIVDSLDIVGKQTRPGFADEEDVLVPLDLGELGFDSEKNLGGGKQNKNEVDQMIMDYFGIDPKEPEFSMVNSYQSLAPQSGTVPG